MVYLKNPKTEISMVKLVASTQLKMTLFIYICLVYSMLSPKILAQTPVNAKVTPTFYFKDVSNFEILGLLPGNTLYSRLPSDAEGEVRPAVWKLSKNSAGISIRFNSNSSTIKIRWTLDNNRVKGNMTPISSNGLDLYAFTKE